MPLGDVPVVGVVVKVTVPVKVVITVVPSSAETVKLTGVPGVVVAGDATTLRVSTWLMPVPMRLEKPLIAAPVPTAVPWTVSVPSLAPTTEGVKLTE